MFSALRGTPLGPSFTLPRCQRWFNVAHRSDPVAYRLEPLLMESGAPAPAAPAYVPFAGDKYGERLHVKVRNKVKSAVQVVAAVQDMISSTVAAAAAAIDGARAIGSSERIRASCAGP
jgi:hypothetical protein